MKTAQINFKNTVGFFCLLASAFLLQSVAQAGEGSGRENHRLGVYIGFIGDPFPTLVGGNLALNVGSFMRLTGGYGSITVNTVDATSGLASTMSATTMGGGLRLFVPHWNLSPVVGLGYASVTVTGSGGLVGGFAGSNNHGYVSAGLDWQTHYGLNLGVGYNYSLLSGIGGLPYFNLGWFF